MYFPEIFCNPHLQQYSRDVDHLHASQRGFPDSTPAPQEGGDHDSALCTLNLTLSVDTGDFGGALPGTATNQPCPGSAPLTISLIHLQELLRLRECLLVSEPCSQFPFRVGKVKFSFSPWG